MDKHNENIIGSTPFPVLPILLTTRFKEVTRQFGIPTIRDFELKYALFRRRGNLLLGEKINCIWYTYRFNCKIITLIFVMLLIIMTSSTDIWRKIPTKSFSNGDRVLRHCLLPPHFLRCFPVLVTQTSRFSEISSILEKLPSMVEKILASALCFHAFSVISWSKTGITLRHSTTWLAVSLMDCFYRRGLDLKPSIG
jgi:hypothetical protein